MVTLRTLGSLSLEGENGETFTPILSQPKRLALLIYLSTARPLGFHRRDTLLTLFWPELTESRARNALSQALSFLRRHLPEGVLVIRGVEEVGVEASVMRADVVEFGMALRRGSWIEALEHYRGDFLRGFHVSGASELEEWMHGERDRLRQSAGEAGWALAHEQVRRGRLHEGERTAQRALSLEIPDETTVQRFMEVVAGTGDRVAALRFYQRFIDVLKEGMDLEPTRELRELVARLRSEDSGVPSSEPDRLGPGRSVSRTLPVWGVQPPRENGRRFADREEELARLGHFLDRALEGAGTVAFVTGDAGTGKTFLAREFCSRSLSAYPGLVTACGTCDAHTGQGDAYHPFRQILRLLTGDVEAQWMAGSMSTAQAERLWGVFPLSVEAILEDGPDLLDTFVPAQTLANRASAFGAEGDRLRSRLMASMGDSEEGPEPSVQATLFQHYYMVLRRLAKEHPLLLVLEDLQWADSGSLDLLFHLGRQLDGIRILVLGLYRISEVALGRSGGVHPLQKVESELRMSRGDMRIALGEGEDRSFIDSVLDSEPNRLGEAFRESLCHLTRGHALFTVELLRELRDEGKIRLDEGVGWVETDGVQWDRVPARVEAVIEERLSRLQDPLREILVVASVEGERFTLEVVAAVLGRDPGELVTLVGAELERRHRLVRSVRAERLPDRRISTFQFRHILFQQFLYDHLDSAERAYLHERVGRALEDLLGDRAGEDALALALHFREAGLVGKAVEYLRRGAGTARGVGAFREGMDLLREALNLIETLPPGSARDRQEMEVLGQFSKMASVMGVLEKGTTGDLVRLKELAKLLGDDETLFWVGMVRYHLYHYAGEEEAGRIALDDAEVVARRSGNPSQAVSLQFLRALNTLNLGQPSKALHNIGVWETLYDPARDDPYVAQWTPDPLAIVLGIKGLAMGSMGYPEAAVRSMEEAHALLAGSSDAAPIAAVFAWDLILRWLLRDADSVSTLLEPYIETVRGLGAGAWLQLGEFSRGWCLGEQGNPQDGAEIMGRAVGEMARQGWEVWLTYYNALLADSLRKIGRAEDALALVDGGLERIEVSGERVAEPEVNRVRGEVLLSLPRPDPVGAEAAFRRAIAVAQKQKTKLYELRATTSLARLLRSQGRGREAGKSLSKCYRWFTEGFEYRDLKEAAALLEELG